MKAAPANLAKKSSRLYESAFGVSNGETKENKPLHVDEKKTCVKTMWMKEDNRGK